MQGRKYMVTVKKVTTKKEIKTFVNFPNILYEDDPLFVPATYSDDLEDWNRKKNPAFEYCDADAFLAYKDGEVVGRIAAILSRRANKTWGYNRLRFSQVDFIDDEEVSAALFNTVENYAKEKGCDEIHGPLGFSDMDREGMLVDGFDKRNQFFTYYNRPYYNEHLQKLGYSKDVDWIEYKIEVPAKGSRQAERLDRISNFVLKRNKLYIANVKHRWQYPDYIKKVFNLVNEAYAPLYGVVELSDKQITKYANKFAPLVSPDYSCFINDEKGELVAFGVAAPSIASALKKSNGRYFPFGWIDLLKSLSKNTAIDLLLVAVKPELQYSGINAVIMNKFLHSCLKNGIKYAESGPMLEKNEKIIAQWEMFDKELIKRRRCYIKTLENAAIKTTEESPAMQA